LAKRLALPFYASDEGWACARDKGRFKGHCITVGLDVPYRYNIKPPFNSEMLAQVHYPVIIKPVDSCSQQGLSICWTEEDLISGYQNALLFSVSGDIIVEDYIEGIEFGLPICFINGKPHIHTFGASYPVMFNGRPTLSFSTFNRHFWESFEQQYAHKLELLFARMKCTQGSINLQGMIHNGKFYLLEMGYRLDGLGSWRSYKRQTGYSPLELHVDLQLGRGDQRWLSVVGQKVPPYISSGYQVYCHPGRIHKIVGLEQLKNMDGVSITFQRFQEGDIVSSGNTMYQAAFFLFLSAKDEPSTISLLRHINETIHFYDENGNDMLAYFEDYSIFDQ